MAAVPNENDPAGPLWLVLGVLLLIAGSLLLHGYFDRSGRSRPWLTKLLPGA